MKNNKRGVTAAVVATALFVIVMLTTTITISVNKTLQSSKLRTFATELSTVQDTIDTYIKTTSSVDYVIRDIVVVPPAELISTQFSGETITNGSIILHTIDLEKIGLAKTVYGKSKTEKDVYAISFETGKVYYVQGYNSSDSVYYTLTEELNAIVSGKDSTVVNSNNIIFMPNKIGWTNTAVQVKVKVPSTIDISKVTVTTGNTDINISSATTVNNYAEINVNTNAVEGNFVITVSYELDGSLKTAKYTVASFDNTAPTITVGEQGYEKTVYDSDFYAYISDVIVTDDSNAIKEIKYANITVVEQEAEEYFKSYGTVIKNNSDIRIIPRAKEYTIYAKDYSGNSSIKVVTIDEDIYEMIKNWDVNWAGIEKSTTGVNDIEFYSTGASLINYKIYGNSVQNGTPTPEAPIAVESVGDKTINLFDFDKIKGQISVSVDYDKKAICLPTTDVSGAHIYLLGQSFAGAPAAFEKFNQVLNITEPDYYCLKVKVTTEAENIETTANWRFWTGDSSNEPKFITQTIKDGYLFVKFQITEEILEGLKTNAESFRIYMYGFRDKSTKTNVEATISDIMFVKGNYTYDTMPDYEPINMYKIPVTISGKNKWSFDDIEVKGNDDSGYVYKNITLPAGTYTLSAIVNSNDTDDTTCLIYTSTGEPKTLGELERGVNKRTSITFTLTKEATNIGFYASSLNKLGYNDYATFKDIQIEKGTTATNYEPYVEPVTTNIYLNEPLRKIGEAADYIDFEQGKVFRKINVDDLGDLTYTYFEASTPTYPYGFFVFNPSAKRVLGATNVLCDYYKVKTGFTNDKVIMGNSDANNLYIIDSKYNDGQSIKQALAGYKVYTELETTEEENIELPDILTHKGINTMRIHTKTSPSKVILDYYYKGNT